MAVFLMIDMSALYDHPDYQHVIDTFNNSRCKWSLFEAIHINISQEKCPICECQLDGTVTRPSHNGITTITATVDHYRPQYHYSFLKCEPSNYLLMCSECNNIYKGSEFPLHHSTPTRAVCLADITKEKPLIVNPITDDLLALFTLVFKRSSSGKNVLELKPKESTGYLYEQAVETIKLFGLGDCEVNRHRNDNVFHCRIRLLEQHFGVFHAFAKALKKGDRKTAGLALQRNKNVFDKYGFFIFLQKNQFEYLIP